MARPPPQPPDPWQLEAELLALGREHLERRCGAWRIRHLYPHGADPSLLLLAYQELDRRRTVARVGTSRRQLARALRRIVDGMVGRDALARNRRLNHRLPPARPPTFFTAPAAVKHALGGLEPDLRQAAAQLLHPPTSAELDATPAATGAASERTLHALRDALLDAVIGDPEALRALHPRIVALLASAQPAVQRHPMARYLLVKLPLQLVMILVALLNVAYIGAYYFFNDEVLGRFVGTRVSGLVEGGLEMGSIHWNGGLILDLLTGQPSPVTVRDVTVFEPYKSYGGEQRAAAHADHIEATLVLHEIIPWNRLAIPAMFEIPWALHFAEVEIIGASRFDVRGYRDERDDGREVSLIGLRDAFVLHAAVPNDNRGLSFAVDHAVLDEATIDVDFTEIADWRFATTLARAEFGLRFVSIDPRAPVPASLPLQFSFVGEGGDGILEIDEIALPIDTVSHLHMRGGTDDIPYGDIGYTALLEAAGSDVEIDGRLRHALTRTRVPAMEPLPYGTPVIWGPTPTVELRAASRDAGDVLAHVMGELELPEYAIDGSRASIVARVEGPLSETVYHLAAEGLSIDPLDEPAWVVDDARVSVRLAKERAPQRWSAAYAAPRLVATFDTFDGTALDGTIHLSDGRRATIVLPGDDTEPLLIDGEFELGAVNAAQLVPDDPALMATLGGEASGRIRVHELRLGQVTPLLADGTAMAASMGLQRARLEFTGIAIERDRGPRDDGLPRTIGLDGTVEIDEQGAIDWDDVRVSIPGARLRTSGAIDGNFSTLAETTIEVTIDDGDAFARGLAIPSYVDDVRASLTLSGPVSAPTGRDGRLRFTAPGSGLAGATEAEVWIDAGVLHVRGDDVRLLGGGGRVDAELQLFEGGGIASDPRIRAEAELRTLDLGELSGGLVTGLADVELDVGDGDGDAARISDLRVSGTAEVPALRYGDSEFEDATLAFRYTAGQLAVERLVLPLHRHVGPAGEPGAEVEIGRLVVAGTVGLLADPELDLQVEAGGIPLASVAALLGADLPVRGQIGAGTEFDVTGTVARPSVEGRLALVGLTAFGVPLGSGTLEVESDDAAAVGSLAAHREVWAKGELTTGARGDARIDWSIDAVVAIGRPTRRGQSPPIEAQLDVAFDRVGLPLLLRAAAGLPPEFGGPAEPPPTAVLARQIEGQLEGFSAHVLACDAGTTMLSDCDGRTVETATALALAVSLDRAWIRPRARSTVARQQRATARTPCEVAGTLCVEGLSAALEGDTVRLDTPLRLRSPDGTAAELAGSFDLSSPPAQAVAEATACRAPAPPPPKLVPAVGAAPADLGAATLRGTVALGALQAVLEPYGLATAKGLVDVEIGLDGPVMAPRITGRLDRRPDSPSLWIQPEGLSFPIELADLAMSISPQWIAARGSVRVFGETLEFGSSGGERTGFAFAGPCVGHFDLAAKGTLGTRLLSSVMGGSVADARGGVGVDRAFVSGNASPFAIERAEATLSFTDHELRLRPTDGLEEIALRQGRVLVSRCGVGQCEEVPGLPEGALGIYLGNATGAPATDPAQDAIVAELGSRGRATAWGRVYLDPSTGMPLHTELDVRVADVTFRAFDARGRPVAEAEITAPRIALRGAEPIVVQGDIELARARYFKDAIQGADILAFAEDVEVAQTPPPEIIRNLQFDLRVVTDDPLRIENNVASGVEANATVAVTGTYDAPEFSGRIDVESGGRVDLPFLTGTYAIQRGRVNLLGAIEDAEVEVAALREEPIYVDAQPRQLQLLLSGTLSEIHWDCVTDGDSGSSGQTARSCFDYLVLGAGDVEVSEADVRRFGGGGLGEARKPLQVVGHVTEFDIDERAEEAVPRLRGYVPDMRLRLGQIGPELRIATPQEWFDFDYGRFSFGGDYTRGYPGFFLRQSRQLTIRFELLEPITLEFSRRIRSYLNQRVVFDPLTQRTLELRFDFTTPSLR